MVKITILIDNKAPEGSNLIAEHGFSALIEDQGEKLLFDTGASNSFLTNAQQMGVHLSDVDALVISHAHWDHSGGVKDFVSQWQAEQKVLYVGQHFFQTHYSNRPPLIEAGAPFDVAYLEQQGIAVHYCKAVKQLSTHCYVVSGFERSNVIEEPNEKFLIQSGENIIIDEFTDECALVIKRNEALHLLVGCAHIGILNMVEHVKNLFNLPVVGVYGGIHLMDSPHSYITAILENLSLLGVKGLGLCHCSGDLVHSVLETNFSNLKSVPMGTGTTLSL